MFNFLHVSGSSGPWRTGGGVYCKTSWSYCPVGRTVLLWRWVKCLKIGLAECGWNRYPERWWDIHPWRFSRLLEAKPWLTWSSVGNNPALSGRLDERPPGTPFQPTLLSCGSTEGHSQGGFSVVILESSAGSLMESSSSRTAATREGSGGRSQWGCPGNSPVQSREWELNCVTENSN